jgi:hypothetical protein
MTEHPFRSSPLVRGIRIAIVDERSNQRPVFRFTDGICLPITRCPQGRLIDDLSRAAIPVRIDAAWPRYARGRR